MRPFRLLLRDTLVYGVLGTLTALFGLALLILAHGCADREPLSSDECIELCGDICGGYCDPHMTTTTQDTSTTTTLRDETRCCGTDPDCLPPPADGMVPLRCDCPCAPLGADEEEMLDGS